MVSSNTESGITVTYEDSDNTLDFAIGTLNQNTTGSAATLTTPRNIHGVAFDGSANIDLSEVISDTVGAMFSSNTETNITVTYQDSDNTIDLVVDAAQPNITSLGTLTSLTVDDITIDGSTISDAADLTLDVGGVSAKTEATTACQTGQSVTDLIGTLQRLYQRSGRND